jgi:hypothetical protein
VRFGALAQAGHQSDAGDPNGFRGHARRPAVRPEPTAPPRRQADALRLRAHGGRQFGRREVQDAQGQFGVADALAPDSIRPAVTA